MPTVDLLNLDRTTLELILDSPESFQRRHRVSLDGCREPLLEAMRQTLHGLTARRLDPRWWGYLAIDPEGRRVVGTCAFKGAPDADGCVEIAYFTFPAFEGRGYATAMARALIRLAAEARETRRIVALTLPERNASCRVLEKVGFALLGDHVDPEDGRVWRWTLDVGAASGAGG